MRQTALIEMHRQAGAKLVDFAGWEMPLHYGSQLEEHHQVRRDAGMFDVSHMLAIDVVGTRARECLRHVLANDVAKLTTPGGALYSCMLNASGGVLDDLIVYFLHEQHFRLVVNAGTAAKDLAWLSTQQARFQVELTPRHDLAIIAVQGPGAREKVCQAMPRVRARSETLRPFSAAAIDEFFVARTGYTGEDGFEILLPAARAVEMWQALVAHGVKPAGLGARDTLRLEAGMNLYGQDMDENVSPLECGLAWTVSLDGERDFIGKEALLGAPVKRQRAGLVLLDRGVLRAHQAVKTAAGDGEITSGGFSPTMNRSIALARVPRANETSPRLPRANETSPSVPRANETSRVPRAVPAGQDVEVIIRDQPLRARVVEPPFVRNGKVRVQI